MHEKTAINSFDSVHRPTYEYLTFELLNSSILAISINNE